MRLIGFATGTLMLAACGGGSMLLPELGADLTRFGGCGDVVFYAVDERDRVMITFQAEGLVEEARASEEEESEFVLDLSTTAATAWIEYGERVSSVVCNDIIVPPGPRVDRVWTATAGSATLRIRPESGEGTFADLVLAGVVFSSDGAEDITLEEMAWTDVVVGWYPG